LSNADKGAVGLIPALELANLTEKEEVQNFVEDQLRKGYIKPSKSPQMSPVFFIGKKDGSKRMVIDYCNLNDQTVKNNYPLPFYH